MALLVLAGLSLFGPVWARGIVTSQEPRIDPRQTSSSPSAPFQMQEVAELPTKSAGFLSRPTGFDLDHDGRREFTLLEYTMSPSGPSHIEFQESIGDDLFQTAHVLTLSGPFGAADAGDADGDGLSDLVVHKGSCGNDCLIRLHESLSSDSYPTSLVWEIPSGVIARLRIAELDGDGLQEIVVAGRPVGGGPPRVTIYENTGDNSFAEVFHEDFPEMNLLMQSMEVAEDIDSDGRKEILVGGQIVGVGFAVFAIEATGDNSYARTWSVPLAYQGGKVNAQSIVDGGDLDGDGRKEFLAGGLKVNPPFQLIVQVFEAISDNDFQVVKTFVEPYGSTDSIFSADVADFDGDGKREVVLGSGTSIRIYENTGEDAWHKISTVDTGNPLFAMGTGDHDADGKDDLIFSEPSFFGKTWIWEVIPPAAADADRDGVVDVIDNCPIAANSNQEDADGDATGDACDCAPADPGAFAVPVEVTGLVFEGETTLVWDSQASVAGTGMLYDVIRGALAGLPVGSATEACLEDGIGDAMAEDPVVPPTGEGSYYLIRGANVCGIGSYGLDSLSNERVSSACP